MTSSHFLNPDQNKKNIAEIQNRHLLMACLDEIRSGLPKLLISVVKVLSFSLNLIFILKTYLLIWKHNFLFGNKFFYSKTYVSSLTYAA